MNLIKIGKFIAEQRKNKKLTQEQLAEKLGINNRTISRWENGINIPDASLYKKICEVLECTPGDILDYKITNCSFIVMMLVLQFIKEKDKQTALQNIYNSLNKGGAFILVDKVKTSVLDIHDMYNDLYYDFKRENGLTDTEIIDKNVSLRGVQKCLTVEENIQLLKEVGFNKIDIFYKNFNFVGIVAIK